MGASESLPTYEELAAEKFPITEGRQLLKLFMCHTVVLHIKAVISDFASLRIYLIC